MHTNTRTNTFYINNRLSYCLLGLSQNIYQFFLLFWSQLRRKITIGKVLSSSRYAYFRCDGKGFNSNFGGSSTKGLGGLKEWLNNSKDLNFLPGKMFNYLASITLQLSSQFPKFLNTRISSIFLSWQSSTHSPSIIASIISTTLFVSSCSFSSTFCLS